MSNTFTGLVRLSSDPDVRFIPSGKAVLNFNAASNVGFGDKQTTLWLRCTVWNNPEKLAEFLSKGSQCVVSGELSQREYESNGEKRTSLELNVHSLDLVGGKREQGQEKQAKPVDNFDDFNDDIEF
jgi:single-strand DNA-binding protein